VEKLAIEGGVALNGEVVISGAKNAALPILCAALLTAEPLIINGAGLPASPGALALAAGGTGSFAGAITDGFAASLNPLNTTVKLCAKFKVAVVRLFVVLFNGL